MERNCRNCGKPLPRDATRRRRFCDDICRVEFNRAQSVTALYGDAMNAIYKLGKAKHGNKPDAIESLKTLKRAIDDQLRVLGDADTKYLYEMLGDRK